MPTASAVAADVIDMVVGRAHITFKTLELWSGSKVSRRTQRPRSGEQSILFKGGWSRIAQEFWPISPAGPLGKENISIASMIQRDAKPDSHRRLWSGYRRLDTRSFPSSS